MAKARAIVKRLKAVKNIRKITRTMELIATARFKRAMDRASQAAAYTRKISEIVADLSRANLQISHPLLEDAARAESVDPARADVQPRPVRRLQRGRAAARSCAGSAKRGKRDETLSLWKSRESGASIS